MSRSILNPRPKAVARLALPAILALTACLPGACPVAAAPPKRFFGMQAWQEPFTSELGRMSRGGAGTFRASFTWASIQPAADGPMDWSRYDRLVAAASAAHMNVLPVIFGSPGYAAKRQSYPPRSSSARRRYVTFVKALVHRYGRGGSFAKSHAGIRAITQWQVWNEPNLPYYWTNGRPSARQYVALLRLTRSAIRKRDSRARVVGAGLPESRARGAISMIDFLTAMYRAKGRPYFDAVALHPYAADDDGVEGALIRCIDDLRLV